MADFNALLKKVKENKKDRRSDKTKNIIEWLKPYNDLLIKAAEDHKSETNTLIKPVFLCELSSELLVADKRIKESEKYEEKTSELKNPKGEKTEVKLKKWYVSQQIIENIFGERKEELIYSRK